jgi:hypothetical protein
VAAPAVEIDYFAIGDVLDELSAKRQHAIIVRYSAIHNRAVCKLQPIATHNY